MSGHLGPCDSGENECSWCGDDLRAIAFCSPTCESDSRIANAECELEDDTIPYSQHDLDLAILAARGL